MHNRSIHVTKGVVAFGHKDVLLKQSRLSLCYGGCQPIIEVSVWTEVLQG